MTDQKRMNLQGRLSPGRLFDREPVMFMAVVQALLALLIAFGLNLTGDQVGAIMAFSAALLALVVRQNVTPTPPMQQPPAPPEAPSELT